MGREGYGRISEEGLSVSVNTNDDDVQDKESMVAAEVDLVPAVERRGTLLSSAVNAANTVLGAGSLSLPFAFASGGMTLSLGIMAGVAAISMYTLTLLMECGDRSRGRCAQTYEGIAYLCFGKWGKRGVEATYMFGGLGTTLSYCLLSGQLVSSAVFRSTDTRTESLCIIVAAAIAAPLCALRSIHALRFTSFISVAGMVYIGAIIIATPRPEGLPEDTRPVAARFEGSVAFTLSIMLGAFSCHINCLPTYDEMRVRTKGRMATALSIALAFAAVLYVSIAVAAYSHLGSAVCSNVLQSLDPHNPAVIAVLVLTAVNLIASTPLVLWPFRSVVLSALFPGDPERWDKEHVKCSLALLVLSSGLAVVTNLASGVSAPLSIVGAVAGAMIVFIWPASFAISMRGRGGLFAKGNVTASIVLIGGALYGCIALGVILYKLTSESKERCYRGSSKLIE